MSVLYIFLMFCHFMFQDTFGLVQTNGGQLTFEYEGHNYTFVNDPVTWEFAYKTCVHEGGYLAILEDIHEVNFISHAMEGNLCTNIVFKSLWIGGKYTPDKKRWYWIASKYEIPGKMEAVSKLEQTSTHIDNETSVKMHVLGYPPWDVNLRPGLNCLSLNKDTSHEVKFSDSDCNKRHRFICEKGCFRVYNDERGHWEPESCVGGTSSPGDECKLVCNPGYALGGPDSVRCLPKGWSGSYANNDFPSCRTAEEVSNDLVRSISDVSESVGMRRLLFYLDVADGMTDCLFNEKKLLIENIVRIFPLSETLVASLTLFSTKTQAEIIPPTTDTCTFLSKLQKVRQRIVTNNLRKASTEANSELHNKTIVVIIGGPGGQSSGSKSAVSKIKQDGGIVVGIGVGGHNKSELRSISSGTSEGSNHLFFDLEDSSVFKKLNKAIGKSFVLFNGTCPNKVTEHSKFCPALENVSHGRWEPKTCGTEGGKNKAVCQLSCDDGYDLKGKNNRVCKKGKWNGTMAECTKSRKNENERERERTDVSVARELNISQHMPDMVNKSRGCPKLKNATNGKWDPPECITKESDDGQKCQLTCSTGYEVKGSEEITCKNSAWKGQGKNSSTPKCLSREAIIGSAILTRIKAVVSPAGGNRMLFVVDESGSLSNKDFALEKQFVKVTIQTFPVSKDRPAGMITFSSSPSNHISLGTTDTCQFMKELDAVRNVGGGTDIAAALKRGRRLFKQQTKLNGSVIFLITDGQSQTDPHSAAESCKKDGIIIFTIGVSDYDKKQLLDVASEAPDGSKYFFGIKDFNEFSKVANYITKTMKKKLDATPKC